LTIRDKNHEGEACLYSKLISATNHYLQHSVAGHTSITHLWAVNEPPFKRLHMEEN